jgi:hypothetical protein
LVLAVLLKHLLVRLVTLGQTQYFQVLLLLAVAAAVLSCHHQAKVVVQVVALGQEVHLLALE